jgi:VanZ family protein
MKFLRFWFPVIGYFGIIFYASSLPGVKTPVPFEGFDKVLHSFEYLPWGFLVTRALAQTLPGLSPQKTIATNILLVFLCGISDEFHQSFVPGRETSLADVMADMVGGWAGGLFYQHVQTLKKRLS